MKQESMNKQIIITSILLFGILVIFQVTNLDIKVQEVFYNFDTSTWLLDRDEPVLKLILYTGMKKALIAFAVIMLFILVLFRNKQFIQAYKKGMLIVVLSAIFVPMVVISLKATTNTPCPKNISHFGGNYPDIKVFDSYPSSFKQEGKIRCWPAGHASAGFALMSIFFLFRKKRNQYIALTFAFGIGWISGLYKMLIGDHFLSHTIITMLLAWLIILLISKFVERINIAKSA